MAKLTQQQKSAIVSAALKYMSDHTDVSQVAFAKLVGVEKTYVNHILNEKTKVGDTVIADKYFMAIANFLVVPIRNLKWTHFNTDNFKKIVNKLNAARQNNERCGIDGSTGVGKTYACEMYKKKYPTNTFLVKCTATDNAKEFTQAIANEVGVSEIGTKGKIIKKVCAHLNSLGNDPMLIIDETENLGRAGVEIVKVLADLLESKVALAIVGIDIRKILLTGSKRKKQGYMQANRRFSFGWVECSDVSSADVEEVCLSLGMTNQSAIKWMQINVRDYDSLRRVCTDALTEAEKSGSDINKQLLDDLFFETIKYR